MLDAVIRFSLRHRPLIVILSVAALLYGSYLTTTMPIDVFPDLDRPRVVILTECPGLAPEEVETLVTHPIESAVLGANGVAAVRSQSSMGLVVIYVEFDWRTDLRSARQTIQERLSTVASIMPEGVRPIMTPPTSIMGQIMHVGVTRQRGPRGGVLVPIGDTGVLAELPDTEGTDPPETGSPATGAEPRAWRPIDRRDVSTWKPVEATFAAIAEITPSNTAASNTAADATARAERVDRPRREGPRRFRVQVGGRAHDIAFADAIQQQMDLRATVDWILRPRLLRIAGIAEVIVMGGERKQYHVEVNPERLVDYRVSLQQVEDALAQNNLNTSGGFTEEGDQERAIRVLGRLGPGTEEVLSQLREIPVDAKGGRPVTVQQVAEVKVGAPPKRGDATVDGSPAIVITLVKQPHVDTRGLTDRIHETLADAEKNLTADMLINRDLFQLKSFIDRGIYYVGEALVVGAILVVIILALFLLNLRTTFITLTAIPLSLVMTTLAFRLIGWLSGQELSINVMTLGGLAVAMGELVDDAIVDVENIYRRLRENHQRTEPRPALQVVYEASREIRSAIVFGTLVVILVFLPLFAMTGVEGRLFAPLGVAYIVSILASLVVSLTVTPVLSYYLLPQSRATHRESDGLLLRTLKTAARPLVLFSMRHAGGLLVLTWLLVAGAVFILTRLGSDFLPQFDEGSMQVNVSLPAGASLEASRAATKIIDRKLSTLLNTPANPAGPLLHFLCRTGRAELDEHAQPVGTSEYIVSVSPTAGVQRDALLESLLKELKEELPGVAVEADQPLAHMISHMLSGVNAHLAIKIFGDDLDTLQRIASRIQSQIREVPGLTEPIIESQTHVDELQIVLRPEALTAYGISREYVAKYVQTALHGDAISQVLEGPRRFDLVVRLRTRERTDYLALRDLRVDLPDGRGLVKLADLADFPEGKTGPNQLMRENVRRRMVIRCNVLGRDLGTVAREVEDRVGGGVALPEGYHIEYGGQFESQRNATTLITVLALVSFVGVFVVLLMLHPSVRIVLQILNAIPTAFVGGVAALWLTGQTLTVASLVGFVSLGGIAVRNGILLVTHYFHLLREEGEPFSQAMVLRGSLERLSPVLMTALTAGIGLLPIVVGGRKPGLEILYPVATVILGGLITSTLCEFLLHPGLFWNFSGKDADRIAHGGYELDDGLGGE